MIRKSITQLIREKEFGKLNNLLKEKMLNKKPVESLSYTSQF